MSTKDGPPGCGASAYIVVQFRRFDFVSLYFFQLLEDGGTMAAKYDGYAPAEVMVMDRAFMLMQRASSKARTALLGGDLTAYRKCFEAAGTAQLMKVSSVVNEIDQAISQRPITFAKLDRDGVNVDTKGLCAYVFLVRSGQYLAHFGSGMRIMVVWKTHANKSDSYLAQTMYHELSHKVASTRDHNYNEPLCLGFSKTAPATAASNAENYNLFLREYM
jgi:hypothetical protein